MKLISEIGLNHGGSEKTASKMLKAIVRSKSDGVTYQIKKKSWYTDLEKSFNDKNLIFLKRLREKDFIKNLLNSKKFNSLELSDSFYVKMIKYAKKNKKKIGFAVGDQKKIKILSKAGADFFKILSEDFKNLKLIEAAINSRVKTVYISIGDNKLNDIKKLLKKVSCKKIVLAHTRFNNTIAGNDLPLIKKFKLFTKLPIAFINHCSDKRIFKHLKKYKLQSVFIYVKESNYKMYPDDKHAINLNKINQIYNSI